MTSPAPDPSPATAAPKICFNTLCLGPRSAPPQKKGWRLRSGDLADLCDACFSSYEKGIFCENFHSDIAGWRNCESCRKRMHCGCIISAPTYILRDTGGVDCVPCARKVVSMTPKQMMSSSLLLPQQASERLKDSPPKGHNQRTGPYPGQQRRQAANMWNVSGTPSELQQRLAYEFDRPNAEKLMSGLRSSASLQEKRIERCANGNTLDSITSLNNTNSEVGKRNTFLDSGQLVGENDSMFTRKGLIPAPHFTKAGNNFGSHPKSSSMLKDSTTPRDGFAAPISSPHDTFDPTRASKTQEHGQIAPQLRKQLCPAPHDIIDPCEELQAHTPNGRPRADFVSRARGQLLPRYWPRLTNQELKQISGDSNSAITPLFEKMLSASDAGRIGRLVLPKKCAEAYFPQINQPEGLPLKVQDATGKEWVFQFRFWPNNNSRMYVLEGVTPCIQSMQLQAGDTVTFSRIGSEGKLIMGFRKASSISGELDIQRVKAGSGFATPIDITDKSSSTEFIPNLLNRPSTSSTEVRDEINEVDERSLSKVVRAGFIQKNGSGPVAKSSLASSKRKGSVLGSKSKRLRIIHEDSIQLKLSWEAAQDLLRPPPNKTPNIVIIDGHEFEEYEEAPVIGMPTIFTTNQNGDKSQWAQCEECSKWRMLPVDALLPSRWTCSDNTWDPERSSCSSAEEPSVNQLAQFLPIQPGTSKRSKINEERDDVKAANGLDTLANLAILGEGKDLPSTSSQATTKHPRHRPGCTCIVCIQPPSGKGPKHKPNCTCNVCLTVKRRFRTLMLRKEQRQSEKEAESCALKQQQQQQLPQQPIRWLEMSPVIAGDSPPTSSPPQNFGANNDEAEQKKALPPPLKACIDLNLQPEREEELSAT